MIVNATEFQNNVGRFLQQVQDSDIVITKNGKEVARLIAAKKAVSFLSDSLLGILPNDFNASHEKQAHISAKYGL